MNKVTSKAEIGSTKSLLKKEFDMKELGEAKKILGMEIARDRSRKIMRVSQSEDCDVKRMSKVPYANAVEILMYLMVCTRPDIAYAGTTNVGLVYGTNRGNNIYVTGFVDSDYAKDPDKGRGKVYGLYGGCEGSYLAKGTLRRVRLELNTVAVNCDNQGAIHLSRNHVFPERTKHINVRYHFIREVLEEKMVKVLKANIKPKVETVRILVLILEKVQGDEEEEYPFVNEYQSFKEEPIMFVEDESCPVYDTDNEKDEDGDKEEVVLTVMKEEAWLFTDY
ncbi:hypothetical protein Tco_0807250 [Tanacetum coccineum]